MPFHLVFHRTNGTSSRPPSPSPNRSFSPKTASRVRPSLSRSVTSLRPPSPSPSASKQSSRFPPPIPTLPPSLRPSTSEPLAKSSIPRQSSPSPRSPPVMRPDSTRPRVPSRTQLRHASAAHRLPTEGFGKDILKEDNKASRSASPGPGPVAEECISWSGIRSTIKTSERRNQHGLKRKVADYNSKEINPAPEVEEYVKPPPSYLKESLQAAGVKLMADSGNTDTVALNKDFIKATILTPQSVLHEMQHGDHYFVWVAAMLAMEEKSPYKYDFEEVVQLAFTKFMIEFGSVLVECLNPNLPHLNLPHYTFIDPRNLMHPEGIKVVRDQAIAIVEGLEKKDITRDRIYISIPATETGLAVAKELKEQRGIKTNLVFVSRLRQAAACAAVGAAAVTMPVDMILTFHEEKLGVDYAQLNPHPGQQNIKATACYMKLHGLETQVIASNLRSITESEHCTGLDYICLDDDQVEPMKWHRMEVNCPSPPKPTTYVMTLAKEEPYPPNFPEDRRGRRICYFSSMQPEGRYEAAVILHAGLKRWQDASACIVNILRREMQNQIDSYKPRPVPQPPSPKSAQLAELRQYELAQLARRQGASRLRGEPRSIASISGSRIEFPRKDELDKDELDVRMNEYQYERADSSEPPSVPQSPYWTDMETFENEPGSSSDEETTDDMILF